MNWAIATYSNRVNRLLKKEHGYLPVNAEALARLRKQFPDHSTWKKHRVKQIIRCIGEVPETNQWDNYEKGSLVPELHFGYSCLYLCDKKKADFKDLISEGIQKKYDFNEDLMYKNTVDPVYQASMIYILARTLNIEIRVR
jgi:hypothetical protein